MFRLRSTEKPDASELEVGAEGPHNHVEDVELGIWNWLRGRESIEEQDILGATDGPDDELSQASESEEIEPEPIELEISDVLDLHSFPPREVKDVVRAHLDAAYDEGIRSLRIIHGRGKGVQRKTVQTLLSRDPRVRSFQDAPQEAGGWGATVVELE